MREISRKIIQLRNQNNMTQQELGRKLEVDLQTVCEWETGEQPVSANDLRRLANVFNIPMSEFVNENSLAIRKAPIKYIFSTSILGILLLIGLILNLTVKVNLMELWKTRYMQEIIWYMVYVEATIYAIAGAFIPSLISLKADLRLHGKIRWILLCFGIAALLLYLYLGVWMTFAGFKLQPFLRPLARNELFALLRRTIPFVFGLTAFLGINH